MSNLIRSRKSRVSAVLATAALAVGLAAPAAQAQPVVTGGLVNVTVVDVIDGDVLSNNNVGVGVAASVAASLCDTADVNVGVLAQQVVRNDSTATCPADSGDSRVEFTQVQRPRGPAN